MNPADSACLPRKSLNNRHIMTPQRIAVARFSRTNPCPVCGGHDGLARGKGARCFGYYDRQGEYARCTREEHAGSLPQNRDGTYSHRLHGPCRCGRAHGDASGPAGKAHASATPVRRRAEKRFRSYFTLRAFLIKYHGDGTTVTPWVYRGADGREAFRVLRIDYRSPDGAKAKSYRPCHEAADGRWLLARPEGKLPLYNLPAILAAPPEAVITLLEGEKCSDIASALGLRYATASAHGAKATWLSDWSPLAGRNVSILPDADEDGARYAAGVSALLADLDPPARTHVVRLPGGLSDGEDIEQWIAQRRDAGLTDADLLAELAALIAFPG
jgi:hypothetical protein